MKAICPRSLPSIWRWRRENSSPSSARPAAAKARSFISWAGSFGADSGLIEVGGKPVTGPGTDRGVVFQEYALFPWLTVTQNIRYGLE